MIELFVISTQMLLANLFLWNRCAPRRYSIVTTIGIYAFFRLILVGAGELLNSLYLDAPLIIFAGFLYIIPIFFLYETKLLKMINIFFFLWIYTFSLYSISYFFSLLYPVGQQLTIFLVAQSSLYVLTYYYYYVYVIPKYSYMIDYISKIDERYFTLLSFMWFAVLFFLYISSTTALFPVLRIAVVLLFLMIVTISSKLIYNLVLVRVQMTQLEVRLSHKVGQYNAARNHLNELRKLSHDINKYNAVIQYALKEKKYDYLEEFSSAAFERLKPEHELPDTGNETFDALVYDLTQQCLAKQIALDLNLDLALHHAIEIPPLDLTTILGNLFENAVEACELVDVTDRRWIRLEASLQKNMLRFKLSNASNGAHKENRKGFKQFLPRQLGLLSVESTVKKNGGIMQRQSDQTYYVVTLALANTKQQAGRKDEDMDM